jgi:hypothetical protein
LDVPQPAHVDATSAAKIDNKTQGIFLVCMREREKSSEEHNADLEITDRAAVIDLGELPKRGEIRVALQGMHTAINENELADAGMQTAKRAVVDGLHDLGCCEAI